MMKLGRILFLNEEEVRSVLPLSKVLELMEKVLIEHAKGTATLPVKLHMSLRPERDAYINSMPSYLREHNVYGVKLAGCNFENPPKGIRAGFATINLYYPENGLPFSIMDGTHITNIRTGAIAGVSAKYMARKNAKVLCLVGAGEQGNSAFMSIMATMPQLEEVRVVDINPDSLKRFVERHSPNYPIRYVTTTSVQEGCDGADIVHAATSAGKPLLRDIKFKPGVTVIITSERMVTRDWIAGFDRKVSDFPECLVTRWNQNSRYYAQREGIEYVDLKPDFADATLGEVVAGMKPGRENDGQNILSASVGMSIEDVICGLEAYERAVEKGLGVELKLLDM